MMDDDSAFFLVVGLPSGLLEEWPSHFKRGRAHSENMCPYACMIDTTEEQPLSINTQQQQKVIAINSRRDRSLLCRSRIASLEVRSWPIETTRRTVFLLSWYSWYTVNSSYLYQVTSTGGGMVWYHMYQMLVCIGNVKHVWELLYCNWYLGRWVAISLPIASFAAASNVHIQIRFNVRRGIIILAKGVTFFAWKTNNFADATARLLYTYHFVHQYTFRFAVKIMTKQSLF